MSIPVQTRELCYSSVKDIFLVEKKDGKEVCLMGKKPSEWVNHGAYGDALGVGSHGEGSPTDT